MTTLREARDVIHGLEEQRLTFLNRKASGELVRAHVADNAGTTAVRAARDRVLQQPQRLAAILAARYQLDERAVYEVLTDVVRELLHALATTGALDPATVLDVLPSSRPSRPPEPPIVRNWRAGFFRHTTDNEHARAWRLANPEQAEAEADYHRRLLAWRAQQAEKRDG